MISDQFEDAGERRQLMVTSQLEARRIRDPQVLAAMRRVPRHAFVPSEHRDEAYADSPLPIGEDQTISQPYIVALMTEMLGLRTDLRVLEVGTGSGYQTAVLAEIVREIFTVEARVVLFDNARRCLGQLDYRNIQFRHGNGCDGWPEFAPFDRIIVTACAEIMPQALIDQIGSEGRMVLPVGGTDGDQRIEIVDRRPDGRIDIQEGIPVRFVMMTS